MNTNVFYVYLHIDPLAEIYLVSRPTISIIASKRQWKATLAGIEV
jgi:hypothetical protein